MFDIIDIHSHINLPEFNHDRDILLDTMQKRKCATICIGTQENTSRESAQLAAKHSHVYACIGTHPESYESGFSFDWAYSLMSEKVVCIGECGYDFFRKNNRKHEVVLMQEVVFDKQIQFAITHHLPLMIHARPRTNSIDAIKKTIEHLDRYKHEGVRANFHFFTSTVEVAKEILDRGWTLSFTGPVTFDTSLSSVVSYVPLDSIHVETDAPYAAPMPFQKTRCEPLMIVSIIETIAQIHKKDIYEVKRILALNANRDFGISMML